MPETWTAISGYTPQDYTDTAVFEVNPDTKKIALITGQALVAGEENSQYIKFVLDRYWDGIDIKDKAFYVEYALAGTYYGKTAAVNAEYTTEQVRFGWIVPKEACCISGTLLFVLRIESTDYVLKTQIAEHPVFKSVNVEDVVPEPTKEAWYRDFAARVEVAIDEAEAALTQAQQAVMHADAAVQNAQTSENNAEAAAAEAQIRYGSPLTASEAALMVEENRVYVYTGSESGYTFGNWYYYDGSAWVSGGVYNGSGVNTDTTLTQSGMPADAKETGDQITELKSGFTKLTTATTDDVGKALKAKTVANGKVTEWEFGTIDTDTVIDVQSMESMTDTKKLYRFGGKIYYYNGTEWTEVGTGAEVTGNYVEYTSKSEAELDPVLIDKTDSVTGKLNIRTGEIESGTATISNFIDISKADRFYRSSTTTSKFLSDDYCLYDKNKNFLAGFAGNTSYTFETIDGHPNCVRYDLNTDGACYIRTKLSANEAFTYYKADAYSVYDAQIKEVADSRTDYNGTTRENLASALGNSYSEIKADFSATNARIEALSTWENVGTADFVYPYHSAEKVKLTAESETTLGVHGITVADADHMGAVTYSNIEEVSDYTGKGKKYRITALGANGNAYRVDGKATGLTVGKTYRICLKVTDPQNDSNGGGRYVQLLCKSSSVKSYGKTVSTEGVFTATFVATATTHAIYIYPFQTNGSGYTQAVGDEFVIEDWYINEVNGDIDLFTHEGCFSESVNGTELQYTLNGAMFVATGTGADVSITHKQSRLMTVNGVEPGDSGDVTVKSHIQRKTVVCFGDSITNKGYDDYLDYPYLSSLFTGLNTINVGIGGTSMRYRTNYDNWNKVSFAHMADMIVSGDFTDIQSLGNTSGFEMKTRCAQLYPIISAIDWSKVDFITIAYGANDHETSTVVNHLDDTNDKMNKYKYLGAFRYALETILAEYPHIQFLVLTPVFRYWTIDGEYTDSDTREFADVGRDSFYYEWGDALMECAENEYHVPVCDLYRELGVSKANHAWFSTDGVHPDWEGLARMGSHVAAALMSKF